MQRLEVSGAVRPMYGSLGVKWLILNYDARNHELKKKIEIFVLLGCYATSIGSFLPNGTDMLSRNVGPI